jgi:hypothetical protein
MNIAEIHQAILDADLDYNDLAGLGQTISKKRRMIASSQKLKIGDRVELVYIKPKYLAGVRGTITGGAGRGKAKVRLDYQVGRFAQNLTVHLESLKKIESVAEFTEDKEDSE